MSDNNYQYSVGITTYSKRFDKWFKPLLAEIKEQRPDIEVVVNINSEYKQPIDNEYRSQILEYCAKYKNVVVSFWPVFRGLSVLWNDCIRRSSNDYTLLLNDDVVLSKGFFNHLENSIREINPNLHLPIPTFKINESWSHIFINRSELNGMGWFDERLLGVGEEDGDAELRYELTYNRPMINITNFYIHNAIEQNDCLNGIQKVHGKYSKYNRDFIFEKYPRVKDDDPNKITFRKYEWPFKIGRENQQQYPYEMHYWLQKNYL